MRNTRKPMIFVGASIIALAGAMAVVLVYTFTMARQPPVIVDVIGHFSVWGFVPAMILGAVLLGVGLAGKRYAITRRCQRCGYDMAGLAPGAACPECGKGPGA